MDTKVRLVSESLHSNIGLTHGSVPARAYPQPCILLEDRNAEGICTEAPEVSDPLISQVTSPVLSMCLP